MKPSPCTVIRFCKHDPRIAGALRSALPHHPHVVDYLASALGEADGSLYVAQMMSHRLRHVSPKADDSLERVAALSHAGTDRKTRDRILAFMREQDPMFASRSVDMLSDLMLASEQVQLSKNLKDGQAPTSRKRLCIKEGPGARARFGIIFNVAYAMIWGAPASLGQRSRRQRRRKR